MEREKVGVDDHVLMLQLTSARLKSWVHDEDCRKKSETQKRIKKQGRQSWIANISRTLMIIF